MHRPLDTPAAARSVANIAEMHFRQRPTPDNTQTTTRQRHAHTELFMVGVPCPLYWSYERIEDTTEGTQIISILFSFIEQVRKYKRRNTLE